MRNRWIAILAGGALAAIVLLALPGKGSEKKTIPALASSHPCAVRAADCDDAVERLVVSPLGRVEPQEIDVVELEKVRCRVEAELARMRDQLEKNLARLQEQGASQLQKQLGKLEAQRAELLAGVDGARAELLARQAELAAQAKELAAQALEREPMVLLGESESGWLGVQITEVTAEKVKELKLPAERGALITEVEPDSPAGKAGLKANDVVTEFNGQRVEGAVQFRRLVRETPAGRSVQLTLWRDGRAQTISVQLGSRRPQTESRGRIFGPRDFDFRIQIPEMVFSWRTPLLGISAEDLSGQLGAYFGVPGGEGVLVREVRSGSPAEKAGLKAGDVITKIDGERVKTTRELRSKLREKREQKTVSLGVVRKGAEMSVNVEIEPTSGGRSSERPRISRRTAL